MEIITNECLYQLVNMWGSLALYSMAIVIITICGALTVAFALEDRKPMVGVMIILVACSYAAIKYIQHNVNEDIQPKYQIQCKEEDKQ